MIDKEDLKYYFGFISIAVVSILVSIPVYQKLSDKNWFWEEIAPPKNPVPVPGKGSAIIVLNPHVNYSEDSHFRVLTESGEHVGGDKYVEVRAPDTYVLEIRDSSIQYMGNKVKKDTIVTKISFVVEAGRTYYRRKVPLDGQHFSSQ